jgi:broad specificity polyphosphatase/5'/3'-nucleotidase SurE
MEYEPIEFVFSDEERKLAADEGHRRQKINEAKNLSGRNGGPETGKDALRSHLIGAAGEMAVASYLGLKDSLYKETEAKRGSYDLPPNIDVKTRAKHYYDMIVQLDDNLSKRFVLVTIENKKCIIHGWAEGVDIAKEYFIKAYANRGPAYFVPKGVLKPMSELKEIISHK